MREASGVDVSPGRDEYGGIGAIDYGYIDLRGVRERYQKSREIYLTEQDADVAVSIEIAAAPDLVWSIVMDPDKGPQWCPTLIEVETLSGTMDQVGSVHTCLHGDAGKMVHFRVAYDARGRRFTDRLSNVPEIGKMIQTLEAKPSASGTTFTLYYCIDPAVPAVDEKTRALFLDVVRQRAENDTQGLKAVCETVARATPASQPD